MVKRLALRRPPGSAVALLIVAVLTIGAPWFAPHAPEAQDLANRLAAPSFGHPFGTDDLGRDIFSRILHGGRFSLSVAALTTLLSLSLGTVLGLISAVKGGWLDELFTRANDMLLALPEIVVALLVIAVLGPGFTSMAIAVSLMSWTPTARLVRSLAGQVLATEYAAASLHLGCSYRFVLRRHVLPALAAPVMAQTALRFGLLLVILGGLSYLGVGVQPPQSDWGSMLADAQPYAMRAPWGLLAPGGAIFFVSLCVTLLGNRLTRKTGVDVLESAGPPHTSKEAGQ